MRIYWNSCELLNDTYLGMFLSGSFDDLGGARVVTFSAPLYGQTTDLKYTVYELIDGEMGDIADADDDMRERYIRAIAQCRIDIRDTLYMALSRYEDQEYNV